MVVIVGRCPLSLSLRKSRLLARSRQHLSRWETGFRQFSQATAISRTRNIGIIAHIDAGKTTTTERMLYYSGHTNRIGDVDEGSTVTDFLPDERARGITIQSAAITFHWPPSGASTEDQTLNPNIPLSLQSHNINLIDTPGHADFTFEVLRSLRVLDGAVCILDGVAGVEAQTETVWKQAGKYQIPRLIYVNKLDRDGAAFQNAVKEIFLKLQVWPALCHIPWWSTDNYSFCGVGDVINLRGMRWESNGDGRTISVENLSDLDQKQPQFATELRKARVALVELLSEHDDAMVEEFLANGEDHLAISPLAILQSLRNCTLSSRQIIAPVFAGASFRNIGVQPLLDAVVDLLPGPLERPDSEVTLDGTNTTLGSLIAGKLPSSQVSRRKNNTPKAIAHFQCCALAFKVVHDQKRGVLVYIRVYHGELKQGSQLFNTTLGMTERASKLLRMYAADAVDIDGIGTGQIGVIVGLKHVRTGDTLISFTGLNPKATPPAPMDSLQLRPIDVPPPLFFASVEPFSLSEEKQVEQSLQILLREDPSLQVSKDDESGQTQLSGMGELHLEIARDRLIRDLNAKARVGEIEIGYRESIASESEMITTTVDQDFGGKPSRASTAIKVEPVQELLESTAEKLIIALPDNNFVTIHMSSQQTLISVDGDNSTTLPGSLTLSSVLTAIRAGANAALARGPDYGLPVHSVMINLYFDPKEHLSPDSSPSAIAACTRQTVQLALRSAVKRGGSSLLLEPVMLATISVNETYIGPVVQDLTSARGAQVISLGEEDMESSSLEDDVEFSSRTLEKLYSPPDPYNTTGSNGNLSDHESKGEKRQITARVPLKEMVGYLKHLRSLTAGRGTFVMKVDRFEPVRGPRLKRLVTELRGI